MTAIALVNGSDRGNAQTNVQTTDREKALEERVKYLEERIRRIEEGLQKQSVAIKPAPKTHAAKPTQPPQVAAAPVVAAPVVSPVAAAPVVAATTPADPAASANSPPTQQEAQQQQPGTQQPPNAADEGDNAPQELNVLRENAVTLKPAGFEVSSEIDYTRRESSLQNDRAYIDTTTLRYGVLNWLELSATVPVGYAVRSTDTSPTAAYTSYLSGVGDISAQANIRVLQQTADWPGVVLSLGFIAPTGPNPYNFSLFSANSSLAPNPRNPLVDYFSLGSWAFHSNIQFFKTVDPLILFVGFGFDRVFPLSVGGYTVDGFNRLSYNFGMSFALSEKTTLGLSVNGIYTPDIQVNGHEILLSSLEPTVVRFSVIQRIRKNLFLEPSVSFGMDQDAPDFVLGFGVRARF